MSFHGSLISNDVTLRAFILIIALIVTHSIPQISETGFCMTLTSNNEYCFNSNGISNWDIIFTPNLVGGGLVIVEELFTISLNS